MRVWKSWWIVGVTLTACSSVDRAGDGADASTQPTSTSGPSAPSIPALEHLRTVPFINEHLGSAATLTKVDHAYHLTPGNFDSTMEVVLPDDVTHETRIALVADRSVSISIQPSDELSSSVPRVVGGALVFDSAIAHGDVVLVAEHGRAEEIRILRDASASPDARYQIRPGPGVSAIRVHDGRIEVLDAAGKPRIESAPMVAVDALGTRRDVSVEVTLHEGVYELRTHVDVTGLVYPIAIDPAWTATSGTLSIGRASFSGALAGSGTTTVVLATGGLCTPAGTGTCPASGILNTAEKWDTTSNTWTSAGSWTSAGTMSTVRAYHTTTTIGTRALVVGGYDGANAISTSEVYNGGWGTVKSLTTARYNHTASLLSTGNVLVAGGAAATIVTTAELYDAAGDSWSGAGTLNTGRYFHAAVALPNDAVIPAGLRDSVLIFGGTDSGGTTISSVELWTAPSTWSVAAGSVTPMTTARKQHTATLVNSDGSGACPYPAKPCLVLVAGGRNASNTILSTAELYDPAARTWTAVGNMVGGARAFHSAAYIKGKVLIAGGTQAGTTYDSSTELFDPVTKTFTSSGDMSSKRTTFALVPDSATPSSVAHVLAISGNATGTAYTTSSDVFSPFANGTSCATGTDCLSGICADGKCCNSACTGQCQACDVAGSFGTCTNLDGAAPHTGSTPARTACANNYQCKAGACASSCTDDTACVATAYCTAGTTDLPANTCQPKKAPSASQTCTVGRQCASGATCVDGYCCDTACTGNCEACDVASHLGTCYPVIGTPHGTRPACSPTGTCGKTCVGTTDRLNCTYASTSVSCGTNSCSGGVETDVGKCTGTGTCDGATKMCGKYVCGATACKTSCTANTDCATGYYCKGTACTALEPLGTSCTSGASCASGICTDGVCCGAATCGAGSSCNGPTKLGSCSKINGSACGAGTECGSGNCADGVCCNTACAGQCSACNLPSKVGTCSAVTGAPVNTGAPARAACTGTGAGTTCGIACNGVDLTACHYPTTATSCGTNACTMSSGGGTETDTGKCTGAGTCDGATKSCGSYACGAIACKTTCTTDADCTAANYCKGGSCAPKEGVGTACSASVPCSSGLFCTDGVCCGVASCGAGNTCNGSPTTKGTCTKNNGTTCTLGTECASGFCADGVCCNTSCTNQCGACNLPGKAGICSPVSGAPVTSSALPVRSSCTGSTSDPACGIRCNGTDMDKCNFPGATAACGADTCTGSTATHTSFCDGAGKCGDVPTSCGDYKCGATACKTSCTTDDDCADPSSHYCSDKATGGDAGPEAGTPGSKSCVPRDGIGAPCTTGSSCPAGLYCTDKVCCGVAACPAGSSCAKGTGKCLKDNGTTCSGPGECNSGFCTDGVCCDTACDGQCLACDNAGKAGQCSAVSGDPHGTRPKCDDGGSDVCKARTCDGATDGTKCVGYKNGATTKCAAPSCMGSSFTSDSTCDGMGECKAPLASSCAPYACDAKGCLSACTTNDDCANGFTCTGGKCLQGATCSDDKSESISKMGEHTACQAYICGSDGLCKQSCGATTDCASGFVCGADSKCTQAEADQSTDSGCGCVTAGHEKPSTSALIFALCVGSIFVRRRRAS